MNLPSKSADYQFIGKMVLIKRASLVEELLSDHQKEKTALSAIRPKETTFDKIFLYFIKFCRMNNKNPGDLLGYLRNREDVNDRQVFVASLLHLYSPALYQASKHFLVMERRSIISSEFIHTTSEVLNIYFNSVDRMIPKIVFMEKTYEDFKCKVRDVTLQLSGVEQLV